MQAYLLERAGDTTAALQLLCGQLQAAAQALLAGILAGLVPVEQLQPSLHFRAFMQVLLDLHPANPMLAAQGHGGGGVLHVHSPRTSWTASYMIHEMISCRFAAQGACLADILHAYTSLHAKRQP